LEGGSRSSKTWSIIQRIIVLCQNAAYNKQPLTITISRAKLTWLKATLIPDFIKVLKLYSLWNDNDYNKTESIYRLLGSEIAFIGLDQPQKLHGRTQDIFWINESNEATVDDFDQLEMRTVQFGILDYNPNMPDDHWILTRVLTRPDVDYIHSTMLDNPFLPANMRRKILSYEPTQQNIINGTADDNKWKIYGLGIRAAIEGIIFDNVRYIKEFPTLSNRYIGLDFGFVNDVTAVCEVGRQDGSIYGRELIYQTGLTNGEINKLLLSSGVTKLDTIIADAAEMKSIRELEMMGWKIIPAEKGPGSVNFGIDLLKAQPIIISDDSVNWRREAGNYTWMKNRATGQYINTPVDNFNHLWDACRYVAQTVWETKKPRMAKQFSTAGRRPNL
jgi:phage terminase large subunit